MTSARRHFRRGLSWLERALWGAGCGVLGYCAFTLVDASRTQARLAQSLEQSRIRTIAANQPAVDLPTEQMNRVTAHPGTSLVARLQIPRVGLSSLVVEGVGLRTLRAGLGHVPGTSWPGQPGNVAVAGHRDTFFQPLRNIKVCDEISVDTATHTYHYRVSSFEIVDPHDVNEITFHGKDELTLITCYPFSYIGPAPKRFIVHAEPVLAPEKCPSS